MHQQLTCNQHVFHFLDTFQQRYQDHFYDDIQKIKRFRKSLRAWLYRFSENQTRYDKSHNNNINNDEALGNGGTSFSSTKSIGDDNSSHLSVARKASNDIPKLTIPDTDNNRLLLETKKTQEFAVYDPSKMKPKAADKGSSSPASTISMTAINIPGTAAIGLNQLDLQHQDWCRPYRHILVQAPQGWLQEVATHLRTSSRYTEAERLKLAQKNQSLVIDENENVYEKQRNQEWWKNVLSAMTITAVGAFSRAIMNRYNSIHFFDSYKLHRFLIEEEENLMDDNGDMERTSHPNQDRNMQDHFTHRLPNSKGHDHHNGQDPRDYGHELSPRSYLDWRKSQGLLTISNHRSMLDDPPLMAALIPYSLLWSREKMRYGVVAADVCFQNSLVAFIMGLGKALPIKRSAGLDQPLFYSVVQVLQNQEWLHYFPEGRVEQGMGTGEIDVVKRGVAKLIALAKFKEKEEISASSSDSTSSHSYNHDPIMQALPVVPIYHEGMEKIYPQDPETNELEGVIPQLGQDIYVIAGEPIPVHDILKKYETTCHIPRASGVKDSKDCLQMYEEICTRISLVLHILRADLRIRARSEHDVDLGNPFEVR